MLDFQNYSLWIVAAAFLVAAGCVWVAGSRLSRYVSSIADETGIGAGFLGFLLLGGITSLPEVATVSTASAAGNAALAINNLLGSSAINIVHLALADAFLGRRALTSTIGEPTPLLQGVLGIVVLTVVVMTIAAGDYAIFGVGIGALTLVVLFVFAIWLSSKYQHHTPWVAEGLATSKDDRAESSAGTGNGTKAVNSRTDRSGGEGEKDNGDSEQPTLRSLVIKTTVAGLVILVAGYVLAMTGDAIATRTGIGSSLVGLVLVGFATTLPEISSIYAAVKMERYSMVLGDVFGTNIFNMALIFLADVWYSGEPVLSTAGTFETVATLLTILLTAIYLVGLLERQDRTVWRMGYPSLAIIVTYAGGLALLYRIGRAAT